MLKKKSKQSKAQNNWGPSQRFKLSSYQQLFLRFSWFLSNTFDKFQYIHSSQNEQLPMLVHFKMVIGILNYFSQYFSSFCVHTCALRLCSPILPNPPKMEYKYFSTLWFASQHVIYFDQCNFSQCVANRSVKRVVIISLALLNFCHNYKNYNP